MRRQQSWYYSPRRIVQHVVVFLFKSAFAKASVVFFCLKKQHEFSPSREVKPAIAINTVRRGEWERMLSAFLVNPCHNR